MLSINTDFRQRIGCLQAMARWLVMAVLPATAVLAATLQVKGGAGPLRVDVSGVSLSRTLPTAFNC
jgi:hypothetical protein